MSLPPDRSKDGSLPLGGVEAGFRGAPRRAAGTGRLCKAGRGAARSAKGAPVRRWLPAPLASAVVLLVWLLLNQSTAPGQVLLGVLLALALPRPFVALRPAGSGLRRPWLLFPLALRVAVDVVAGNLEVMRRILGPAAALAPGFVRVPLELRHAYAQSALAGIVTMTPGTLSADLETDEAGTVLLVHALVATDAAGIAAHIRQRYEWPLRRLVGEL